MAIHWNNGPKAGTVEFTGCVIEVGVRVVRVMSDVWEDERYAEVWDGEKVIAPALSDWAYVLPDGSMSKEYMTGAQYERFYPQAEVDATEETLEAVEEWHRVNRIIMETKELHRQAGLLAHGRRVEVIAGRKVPHGDGYEVATTPRAGQYGDYVALRRISDGQMYYYVSVNNMRVIEPEQYIEGRAVACECCRKVYSEWKDSTLAKKHGLIICRTCLWEAILDDRAPLPRSENAKATSFGGSFLTPKEHRKPQEELFARAIFDGDMDAWLIYADWLDEYTPDGEEATKRAAAIRIMTGWFKPKKVSYKKKDLRVSRPDPNQNMILVEGFPPFKVSGYDTEVVKLRLNAYGKVDCLDAKDKYRGTVYSLPAGLKRHLNQVRKENF